jgi:regulator of replication initiation timing
VRDAVAREELAQAAAVGGEVGPDEPDARPEPDEERAPGDERVDEDGDLRAEIEKLRGRQTSVRRVPAAQRASDASLRQRISLLSEENKRLRREVSELKDELAQLYGERRASTIRKARSV